MTAAVSVSLPAAEALANFDDLPDGVLVVDAAAVADNAAFVEHEHFRRARGPEPVGEDVADVLQHGEGDVVGTHVTGHVADAVLGVGVDADEGDAARLVLTRRKT